jgi:hypothetical protein
VLSAEAAPCTARPARACKTWARTFAPQRRDPESASPARQTFKAGNGRGGLWGVAETRDKVAEHNCGHGVYDAAAMRDSSSRHNAGNGVVSASVRYVLAYGNGSGQLVSTASIP